MAQVDSVRVVEKTDQSRSTPDEASGTANLRQLASEIDPSLCPVEVAARIIGQKWTLRIVNSMIDGQPMRFCEIQDQLGGMNPTTLSNRLKLLEETGLVRRTQISDIPPHVEYSLTEMGAQLDDAITSIISWSRRWLCPFEEQARSKQNE